jgi:hypothetical protein
MLLVTSNLEISQPLSLRGLPYQAFYKEILTASLEHGSIFKAAIPSNHEIREAFLASFSKKF